jgi:DNA-binding NarL/FixJ family response regulator
MMTTSDPRLKGHGNGRLFVNQEDTTKARILVVEDNLFVRQGIVAMINRQPDLVCCGETDALATTAALVGQQRPGLVLLDLRLRDGEAFDLIADLRAQWPEVPVLILSQCDEVFYAEKALRAGAKGYLMKQRATEELPVAIRTVLRGELYVSRELTTHLIKKLVIDVNAAATRAQEA